ncbi:MAG: chlorophyll synthase ChlG, partial [Myxococcota bacterium]
ERWPFVIGAIFLAGPLLCGTSQVVNDWFDRHVDAINEPGRPIPSGRLPGRWGLAIGLLWSALSLAVAFTLGRWIFVASSAGLFLAWAYSAPPFRLKSNGWLGNSAVGFSYESLPWFTGAAALAAEFPATPILWLAGLYGIGAFGILITNDFKALEGDRATGVRSLPVQLGVKPAARLAGVIMIAPQLAVIALVWSWQQPIHAAIIAAFVVVQLALMPRFLRDPRKNDVFYNAAAVPLSVFGMMVSAHAVRSILGGIV